jgi:hypothetical protein
MTVACSVLEELEEAFENSFQKPQIYKDSWVTGYNEFGEGRTLPEVYEGILLDEGYTEEVEHTECWGARLSANGFMDCTEWTLFWSEEEAAEYLMDMWLVG